MTFGIFLVLTFIVGTFSFFRVNKFSILRKCYSEIQTFLIFSSSDDNHEYNNNENLSDMHNKNLSQEDIQDLFLQQLKSISESTEVNNVNTIIRENQEINNNVNNNQQPQHKKQEQQQQQQMSGNSKTDVEANTARVREFANRMNVTTSSINNNNYNYYNDSLTNNVGSYSDMSQMSEMMTATSGSVAAADSFLQELDLILDAGVSQQELINALDLDPNDISSTLNSLNTKDNTSPSSPPISETSDSSASKNDPSSPAPSQSTRTGQYNPLDNLLRQQESAHSRLSSSLSKSIAKIQDSADNSLICPQCSGPMSISEMENLGKCSLCRQSDLSGIPSPSSSSSSYNSYSSSSYSSSPYATSSSSSSFRPPGYKGKGYGSKKYETARNRGVGSDARQALEAAEGAEAALKQSSKQQQQQQQLQQQQQQSSKQQQQSSPRGQRPQQSQQSQPLQQSQQSQRLQQPQPLQLKQLQKLQQQMDALTSRMKSMTTAHDAALLRVTELEADNAILRSDAEKYYTLEERLDNVIKSVWELEEESGKNAMRMRHIFNKLQEQDNL